jgi:hypothetical protein
VSARITKYDEELVSLSRRFLDAARANQESCAILERYGFSAEERARGSELVREATRSFEWEREGRAWNFLSPTPERRVAEARAWHADTRRRYMRSCLRRAEEAAGWMGSGSASRWPVWRKLTLGTIAGLREVNEIASPRAWLRHRTELLRNVARARGPKPADAPPPKDTALVELAGWYERWRLLAHRVFRERGDLMAPYGLTPGKAPPRLRGKEAVKYGEKAAGSLGGESGRTAEAEDDGTPDERVESPQAPAPADPRQRLPLVS